MATTIQFRRGPWQGIFQQLAFPEALPYLAGHVREDGTVVEMLFVGSHDDAGNQLIGPGFQCIDGNLTDLPSQPGLALLQPALQTLWVNAGGGDWFALRPSSPPPPPGNLGTIDGGTWV